jgi:hypothetical protein
MVQALGTKMLIINSSDVAIELLGYFFGATSDVLTLLPLREAVDDLQ